MSFDLHIISFVVLLKENKSLIKDFSYISSILKERIALKNEKRNPIRPPTSPITSSNVV